MILSLLIAKGSASTLLAAARAALLIMLEADYRQGWRRKKRIRLGVRCVERILKRTNGANALLSGARRSISKEPKEPADHHCDELRQQQPDEGP
jgi:hypothetical protein